MPTLHATFAAPGQKLPPSGAQPFNDVVVRLRPRLYRTALRVLGNPDDAQDALQEALLAAYRHLDQFQGRAEISTWLTRIVINAARGRRRRARPTASLEECALAGWEFPDARPNPELRLLQLERRQRLHRMIQRLSVPLRSAIQLHELEGLTLRQAAARLGVKPATLKCRLFRGRARLAGMSRQLESATSRAGAPCHPSKPAHRATNGSDPAKSGEPRALLSAR